MSFTTQAARPFTEARFFTLQIPRTKQMHKHIHRYTQRRCGFAHCACDVLTEGPNPSPFSMIYEQSSLSSTAPIHTLITRGSTSPRQVLLNHQQLDPLLQSPPQLPDICRSTPALSSLGIQLDELSASYAV